MVALTETRDSRAVELLREERAVEVKEAMASTYGGGMTKNWGPPKVFKRISKVSSKEFFKPFCARFVRVALRQGTGVRRTSVLAFEPLFA
jgi:hypothetical protein